MRARGAIPTTSDHYSDLAVMAPALSLSRSASVEYWPLIDGDSGTFQTLDAMRQAVVSGLPPEYCGYQCDFNLRAAQSICSNSGQDQLGQIAALFDYAAHTIAYIEHPWNMQVVQDAKRTIQLGSGDCVSLSVLLATLLASLGYRSRFVAQWVDGQSASHVYVEVCTGQEQYATGMGQQRQYQPWRDTWLALDAVAKDKPMGWTQPTLDGGFEVKFDIF